MAQLLVRNLDDDVKAGLRVRAAEHGRSMEAEVRDILRTALTEPAPKSVGLGSEIAALFKESGLRDGETLSELKAESIKPWIFDECGSWTPTSSRS